VGEKRFGVPAWRLRIVGCEPEEGFREGSREERPRLSRLLRRAAFGRPLACSC
jgi:hypothetical protein